MSSTSFPREPRKKKKRRHLATSISVIPESKTRASPIVGYFPSGYNPSSSSSPSPAVSLFRDAAHPSRFDLVVSPPAPANVRFHASNYKGEPAQPQICSYALGVLDRDSGTLKVIPIASNKILRLEPRVIEGVLREDAGEEEESVTGGMKDLTQMFGTKLNKRKIKVWSSLNQQQNDPSTRENLDVKVSDPERKDDSVQDASGTIIRNIPPYDSSAVEPEKAYLLDEIILSSEWGSLRDVLVFMQSGAGAKATFWQENEYPSFVINRIHKLREIQDEGIKEKHAGILTFITHLLKFWNLRKSSRHSTSSSNTHSHKIPRTIHSRFARLFIDPVSDKMSTETKELLIGYILVLTLFIDNFVTDPVDIAKDMEMTTESLQPYYSQLGCKNVAPEGRAMKTHIKLQAPLEFRDLKKRRNRKQRG